MELGEDLHPAGFDNPKGFWEDRSILEINEQLLSYQRSEHTRLDFAWENFAANSEADSIKQKAIEVITRKLNDCEAVWGFKDPRTCRLLTFWKDVFQTIGCKVCFVIALRNPASVAASLHKRNNIPAEKAYLLWLQHMLPAILHTNGTERVIVDYDELLDAPYKQLARIAAALNLSLPLPNSLVVEEFESNFLETKLRHTHFSLTDLLRDHRAFTSVRNLYRLLSSIACDQEQLDSPSALAALHKCDEELASLAPIVDYVNFLEDARTDLCCSITERDAEIACLQQVLTEHSEQIAALMQCVTRSDEQLASANNQIDNANSQIDNANSQIANANGQIAELNNQLASLYKIIAERERRLDQIFRSYSWRLTKPLRFSARLYRDKHRAIFAAARALWHRLPVSVHRKQKFKTRVFKQFSFLFRNTAAFNAWQNMNSSTPQHYSASELAVGEVSFEKITYVPLLQGKPLKSKSAKLICFYLPQFHPIPENNEWWGEGFTEWTNVRPAQAQFEGHYQPHEPGELGYYNLLDPSVQQRQIELAKLYGIEGFCFYFYWFGGKRLLEAPIANYLNDSRLDFPFCLCWANENWSRRWDGLDSEVLIAQQNSPADDIAFIEYIARYVRDPRYIRIDGKPLLLVYRPHLLPSARETAQRWRSWCRDNGIGEIYLAYTQSFEAVDPNKYDFDAAIEFPPSNSAPPNITGLVSPLNKEFGSTIYDWRIFVERSEKYQQPAYTLFRSVCPAWDNTARRKNHGTVFLHSSPRLYQRWLQNAVNHTVTHIQNPDERLIFVNAWNEWAEGAHLEPDARYGYAYLQATRDALSNTRVQNVGSILVVTHDCHPHGAQFLILETAKQLRSCGFEVSILALGGGKLFDDFALVGNTLNLAESGPQALKNFLAAIRAAGTLNAITSTVVSGSIVPQLKEFGFQVLSLIHELPGVIHGMQQETNAQLIAQLSDKVVFPAELVHQRFIEIAPVAAAKAVIRHQGVVRRNPFKHRNAEAHRIVCDKHNLPINTQIILSIAYMDSRKGPDLFVDMAAQVLLEYPNAVFIWIGHAEREMEQKVNSRTRELGLQDKVLCIGFERDPLVYYAAASVYALTSREDPFPNVVLESTEVGVPVVAFEGASGAGDFILEHGGLLAAYLDAADFARRVCSLLANPDKRTPSDDVSLRQYALDLLHHLDGFPRISVIVPNYNYERYITARLDSIYSQTFPFYEVILLDDASSDNSVKAIKEYIESSNSEAKLLINDKNSGSVFRQWKKGIDSCRGDLVWIAEADDLAEPTFLQELASGFDDQELVLGYCQSKQIDDVGNILSDNYLEYTLGASNCCLTDYCRDGREDISKSMCIKNTIPNISAALFRRQPLQKTLAELGEDLFKLHVAGDWLVYLHVLMQGKICHNKKSLNRHRRHTNSVTSSLQNQNHLDEVIEMQKLAISFVSPPNEIIMLAENYIDQLREQFQLPR
ncbi:MAG TPA: glycoside hydrolase family 99-like domain-containing protein [Spongiibacteraceae bacterium]|nr:glycoside hydrolase family 99-like domain-containing protein [Spongiibacteraceae bacterium]